MSEKKMSYGSKLGLALRCVVWSVVGIVAAEFYIHLIVPYPIFYSTWFDQGIHQPDEQFGFIFTPNYRGAMRHRDGIWREPLELDKNGLRKSVSTHDNQEPVQDVVLMGGASMMFSYGLKNDDTVAKQIAEDSDIPVRVHTLAQPGFALSHDFHKFERFLAKDVHPNVVVLCLYSSSDYQALQNEFSPLHSQSNAHLFQNHQSIVLNRPGLPNQIGRPYFQSYVLAGGCRLADIVSGKLSRLKNKFVALNNDNHKEKEIEQSQQRLIKSNAVQCSTQPQKEDRLTHMRKYFEQYNTKLIVVTIPRFGTHVITQQQLNLLKSDHITTVNLKDSLEKNSDNNKWIANGHYSSQSAKTLGKRIATSIQPLLRQ